MEPPARPADGRALAGPLAESENPLEVLARLPKLPEEQWLHLPVWRQTTAPAPGEKRSGSWLVFVKDGDDDRIVAELRRGSDAVVTAVRPGATYGETADGYTVRPGNLEDSLALLRSLRSAGVPLEHVLHLWTLDKDRDDTVRGGLHTLVALARAAGELGMEEWSLDIVTAGTQQVLPGDATDPAAATATGPAFVIPLEYPTVSARLIDIDDHRKTLPALVGEVTGQGTDRIVALRHGRRWLPGYESITTSSTVDEEVIREGGVYLITGGLGGIPMAMAHRLARHNAKLVLFGRHGVDGADEKSQRRAAEVDDLRAAGAQVEVFVGDVSDVDAVRQAVSLAFERFGALHGVLHAAGLPGMGLMQFKDPDELDLVLAPKVAGAVALALALRVGEPDEIELDFLVLFSSITSGTGGGPGQVDYCAANAFLDTFAHQLCAGGSRVVAVDWGEWLWNAWDDGLAGYSDTLQEFLRDNRKRIGIGFDEGWRSLLRALATGEPRVVVSTQDFTEMVRFSGQFTLAAVTTQAMAEGGGTRHSRPELVTPYQEASGVTEERIAALWSESLHLERVGVRDNFFELGGNSLLGVNIVAALRREFGLVELPPHILYEAPTVAALAKVVESAGSDGLEPADDGRSTVRAQLRRSGLEAAARRRGR